MISERSHQYALAKTLSKTFTFYTNSLQLKLFSVQAEGGKKDNNSKLPLGIIGQQQQHPSRFFLQSSHIRVDLPSYERKPMINASNTTQWLKKLNGQDNFGSFFRLHCHARKLSEYERREVKGSE